MDKKKIMMILSIVVIVVCAGFSVYMLTNKDNDDSDGDKISNIDEPNNIIVLLEETLLKLEEVEFSETLECGAVHETATLVFLDADSANDLASVLEGLRTFIRLLLPKNQKLSEEAKEFLEGLLSGMSVSRDDRQVVICCSFSFDTLKQGYLKKG